MFNTKNIKSDQGSTRPVISVGNHKLKINSISFDQTPYDKEAYNINLHVETEPVEGEFQGFLTDHKNPKSKRYKGQVGRVRFSQYSYQNKVLPNGVSLKRDESALKAMVFLADTLGIRDELDMIESKTIFEFMDACSKLFKNSAYLNMCIAGREWENKAGYINLDLFLPKRSREETPIETLDAEESKLIKFNEGKHIIRLVKKTVEKFENKDSSDDDDFDLF
tara:strand:+ start:5271 stop:5936 length:666 start_codon:yes stop_codon:yes gene_type:complete